MGPKPGRVGQEFARAARAEMVRTEGGRKLARQALTGVKLMQLERRAYVANRGQVADRRSKIYLKRDVRIVNRLAGNHRVWDTLERWLAAVGEAVQVPADVDARVLKLDRSEYWPELCGEHGSASALSTTLLVYSTVNPVSAHRVIDREEVPLGQRVLAGAWREHRLDAVWALSWEGKIRVPGLEKVRSEILEEFSGG